MVVFTVFQRTCRISQITCKKYLAKEANYDSRKEHYCTRIIDDNLWLLFNGCDSNFEVNMFNL